MKRRHFLAAALPALLGWTASGASARSKPAPKPPRRRIKIEVSLLNSSLKLDNTNAHIIVVVTEEDVATYASFLQMYTFEEKGDTSKSQMFGPYLRVTPHVGTDGAITVDAKVQFEEATSASASAPNRPLPLSSNSLSAVRTVKSGQTVTLGGLMMGSDQKQLQLKATILAPHQMI